MKNKKDHRKAKAIGSEVSIKIWSALRVQALREGRKTGEVLDDAIRHHVASILADSCKASLSQIQKMLRHRRNTTTDNYIKTLDPQLQQVANVLDE